MTIERVSSPPIDHVSIERPNTLEEAAQQFEGLLIAQLLRMVRSEHSEDSASSTAVSFAEESLAQSLASSGGLGLAETISRSIKR